jgi:hypothetical protein
MLYVRKAVRVEGLCFTYVKQKEEVKIKNKKTRILKIIEARKSIK